jgi:hypothetical protein
MGFLGPFGSDHIPVLIVYAYWMVCMVGGGLIGIVLDLLLGRRIPGLWRRTAAVSVLMTPPVTVLVLTDQLILIGGTPSRSWPWLTVGACTAHGGWRPTRSRRCAGDAAPAKSVSSAGSWRRSAGPVRRC